MRRHQASVLLLLDQRVNTPPTAVASSTPNPAANDTTALALTGTASSDSDGSVNSYLWEQVSGKAGYFSTPKGGTSTFTPDPYAAAVAVDTPVLSLRFEEQQGTFASDVGGHVGTPTGAAHGGVGRIGFCPSLDGVDDYVQVPHHADFDITGDLTLEAWVFLTAYNAGNNSEIVVKQNTGDSATFDWRVAPDGTVTFVDRVVGDAFRVASTAAGFLSLNTWTHLAVVRTATNVAHYKNGGTPTNVTIAAGTPKTGTAAVRLGLRNDGIYGFQGRIDSVATYATALTAARILAHYNATPA